MAAVFVTMRASTERVFIARPHYRDHWSDTAVNTVALFSDRNAAVLLQAARVQFAAEDGLVFTAARAIHDSRWPCSIAPSASPGAAAAVATGRLRRHIERLDGSAARTPEEFAVLRAGSDRWQLSRLIVVVGAHRPARRAGRSLSGC